MLTHFVAPVRFDEQAASQRASERHHANKQQERSFQQSTSARKSTARETNMTDNSHEQMLLAYETEIDALREENQRMKEVNRQLLA
jgi:hypothetical protein